MQPKRIKHLDYHTNIVVLNNHDASHRDTIRTLHKRPVTVVVNDHYRNSSIVEPFSLPVPLPGLRCTLLRILTHFACLAALLDMPSDLNSRAVFLVASAGAAAAHPGEAAQQVRAHRLDSPRRCAAGKHRELPRLRRWSPQNNRQGLRTHSSAR